MANRRLKGFETSIFSTMTQLSQQAQAVNLAQGFPDFDGPDLLKQAAVNAIMDTQWNQYAPSAGLMSLRQQIAKHYQERYNLSYDAAAEITIFSGATEGIYCGLTGLLNEGDEVLSFAPYFDCYPAVTAMLGGKLLASSLKPPHWQIDWDELEQLVSPRCKVLLLNSPHNPTGRVLNANELQRLAAFVSKHDLLVICDEVYEHLVYDGRHHLSLASLPGMRERCLILSSTAKTFSFTGWKIGYALAPKALTNLIRIPHQYTVFCSAHPLQKAMETAFQLPALYYEELKASYQQRRDFLLASLQDVGFSCLAPEGTYFIMANYSQWSTEKDVDFARWLTTQAKVACLPTSLFYPDADKAPPFVRFAFCKDMATLQEAARRLQAAKAKLSQR